MFHAYMLCVCVCLWSICVYVCIAYILRLHGCVRAIERRARERDTQAHTDREGVKHKCNSQRRRASTHTTHFQALKFKPERTCRRDNDKRVCVCVCVSGSARV